METISIEEDNVELISFLNEELIEAKNDKKELEVLSYELNIKEDINKKRLKWISSNENIVKVDENGKLTLVNSGEATVTCSMKNSKGEIIQDECKVIVKQRLYLYYYGNEFNNITGGYTKSARSGQTFSCKFNDYDFFINCDASAGGGGVYTANKIDLTEYNILVSIGTVTKWSYSDSNGRQLAVTSTNSYGSSWKPAGNICWTTTNIGEDKDEILVVDVTSVKGKYYICNGFNQGCGYVYQVYLEK